MASAGAIRAAKAFVEIGTDTTALQRGLNVAKAQLNGFASAVKSSGASLVAVGATMSAPILAGVKGYADFERALSTIRASANPTAQQLDLIRQAALKMSQATGIAPTAIAQSFSELLKAGMSVEQVLSGAGEAAVKFARVGELETAEAAITMADAMKVFARDGLSAAQITDILSGAADSSSVSIRQITEAFQQTSASAGLAGQSLIDTASAIAILGNEGIKGSDAGTSLKTALLRLMNPTKEAAAVMQQYGIEARNADGSLKTLPEIAEQLRVALGGLNDQAKQQAIAEIFGSDAMRTGAILLKYGADGFNAVKQQIVQSLPVSEKFNVLMSDLWGRFEAFTSAVMRAGIALGTALAPYLQQLADLLVWAANGLATFIAKYPQLSVALAAGAIAITAVGAALIALGFAAAAAGVVVTGLGIAAGIVLSPAFLLAAGISAVVAASVALAAYILHASGVLSYFGASFGRVWQAIKTAISAGDLQTAFELVMAGVTVSALKMAQAVLVAIGSLIKSAIVNSMGAYTFVRKQLGLIGDETASFETAVANAAAGAIEKSVGTAVDAQLAAAQAALNAIVNRTMQKAGKTVIDIAIEWGMSAAGGFKPPAPSSPSNPYGTALNNFIGQFIPKMSGAMQSAISTSFVTAGSFRGQDINRLLQTERTTDAKKQTELLQQIASNTANMGSTFQ